MSQISDDLILVAVARRLDLVSPEGLKQAIEKWRSNPTHALELVLGEMGLLSEEIRQSLANLTKSLLNNVSESLLSEAQSLDWNRQIAASQPADSTDGPRRTGAGASGA